MISLTVTDVSLETIAVGSEVNMNFCGGRTCGNRSGCGNRASAE